MNNNKLIAEFMELPTEVYNNGILSYGFDEGWYEEEELSYHTSWDWLMPVLEKVLDISFQEDGDVEDFYSIRDCVPDIGQTYKAIVQFIKKI